VGSNLELFARSGFSIPQTPVCDCTNVRGGFQAQIIAYIFYARRVGHAILRTLIARKLLIGEGKHKYEAPIRIRFGFFRMWLDAEEWC